MTSNKINSSLDWNKIEIDLLSKSKKLIHSKDIKRMIINIREEVSNLSKEEVHLRSGHSNVANELLEKINADIEVLEGFLLVAAILG